MKQATEWLNDYQAFWTDQLDNLGRYFADERTRGGK
jgi:hypothetical protein